MTKKQISERMRRNRELAAIDRQHRCAHCHAPLRGLTIEDVVRRKKFCSGDCLLAAMEREALEASCDE